MREVGSGAANEQVFRLLVESVREHAIFVLDPTGRVMTWNVGAERQTGYGADEIVGRHFSKFYEADDVASGRPDRALAAALSDGRFEQEGWRVRKDGSRFWAYVAMASLRDDRDELIGLAEVTHDLTEQRKAEDERVLRHAVDEARRWFETTLRSIGDAVIATDVDGRITLMNPVAERLTGYTLDRARAKRLRDIFRVVDEASGEDVESPVERVLREGVVIALADHTLLVRADGVRTPIADSGAPIRDDTGSVRGVVLVFRDVTRDTRAAERRAFMMDAAAALASSLDYTETLSRLAKLAVPVLADWCAVHVVGDDGKIRHVAVAHVDPAKVELALQIGERFPVREDQARGVPGVIRTGKAELHARVTDEMMGEGAQSAEHLRLLRLLQFRSILIVPLTTGSRVLGTMSFIMAESGRHYDDDALAFAEELGRRAGIAVENARLYTAAQRARESADAANRAKDDFLAAVSHELRTPLTAILGWSKMLRANQLDDAKRGHATDTIERNAVTMTRLIEDLLDVSRIVSGKMRIEVRPTELGPVIAAALDSLKPAADAKDVVVERDLGSERTMVAGDAARLQQVVWNLVSNAVKFSSRGGHVRVSARCADGAIEVVVSDQGRGIPRRFLPFVFDPFRQAEGGIARTSGGLGLGLAIAKHLVDLHGGSIEASSEGEGKGATFRVRLPISEPRRAAAGPGAREGSLPQLEGLRVLTVDDEEDARQLVQVVLEHAGARVRTAASAAEAMAAMKAEVPDVLLSDIGMPGETGYDLIRRVRSLPPSEGGNVPAAALTAYARAEDRNKALGAGFMMHVPKPIDPSELISVVGSLARLRAG